MIPIVQQKTVWITGASDGMGRAIALLLSEHDHNLIISSRNKESLLTLKEQCEKNQNTAKTHIQPLDYIDTNQVNMIANELAEKVDIVVLCAGVSQRVFSFDMDHEGDTYINTVNFLAPLILIKQLVSHWKQTGQEKRLIVISSIAGHVPVPLRSMYGSSKRALEHYCETMNNEFLHAGITNIHMSIIIPGFVKTNISYKALVSHRHTWNKLDENQKKGITPLKAATQIIRVMFAKKPQRRTFIGMNISLYVLLWIYNTLPRLATFILSRINTAK